MRTYRTEETQFSDFVYTLRAVTTRFFHDCRPGMLVYAGVLTLRFRGSPIP